MVFSSFFFLFLFLPVVAGIYALSPRPLKNVWLLIASMFFYAWGAPVVLPFLLISCIIDFTASFQLVPGKRNETTRKRIFALAVVINLSALLYYKYFNFAAAEISRLMTVIGFTPLTFSEVLLPIGVSFFTFHKISYLGDIYRGKVLPAKSLVDYCLYILFFPQLVAGPIIRYADVCSQFQNRTHSIELIFEGLTRFCTGLAKKVLIADSLGAVTDQIWAMERNNLSSSAIWLAVICYSFQIFFDFSGYSDMAIGLARVFGFRFKENFDRPYRSQNFTEFWRRWHISLSTFMREYLYIPLGGNRGSKMRTYLNLWITFLLSGLWHGASWNFIFWGAYHGTFLTIDKFGWKKVSDRLPYFINVSITFLLVTIGWLFFRAESLNEGFEMLSVMFGAGSDVREIPRAYLIDNRQITMLAIAALISFAPELKLSKSAILNAACSLILFWLSMAALASRGYAPFLYFKF